MNIDVKALFYKIALPAISFILFGIVFLGSFVIQPSNTLFSFVVYGFTSILFYYILTEFGTRKFLALSPLIVLIILVLYKPSADFFINLRNINWFIFNCLMVYLISSYQNRQKLKNSSTLIILPWFLGFIILYLAMMSLNLYVYRFYTTSENYGLTYFIQQSIKIGGILGFGIGTGYLISKKLGKI